MKKCYCYDAISIGSTSIKNICNGTRELEECSCGGDPSKCDFYPEKRVVANKSKIKSTTIYYAHHRWKYGTEIEKYELDLIGRYFPHAVIFNPATDLEVYGHTEEAIMKDCLDMVNKSDIFIFSSVDGTTGIGVFKEVTEAVIAKKLVLYIHNNELHTHAQIFPLINKTDRVYASVKLV